MVDGYKTSGVSVENGLQCSMPYAEICLKYVRKVRLVSKIINSRN